MEKQKLRPRYHTGSKVSLFQDAFLKQRPFTMTKGEEFFNMKSDLYHEISFAS